jgi:hypothetical protein
MGSEVIFRRIMNETFVVVLIGAVVVALVAMPLLRGRGRPAASPRRPRPTAVDAPDLPDEAAELELDHAMGRLTDEDYEELRARVGPRPGVPAPSLGEEPGQPSSAPPVEVASPGSARSDAGVDERAEALVARYRDRSRTSCPNCGERPESGARFCSSCGQQLSACPACGTALPAGGARFCPGCGGALRA